MGNKTPTEDDVIMDRHGDIVAAPLVLNGVPLFEELGFAYHEPKMAMWWRLCKRISERVTQEKQQELDNHWAFMDRVLAMEEQALIRFNFMLEIHAQLPTEHTAKPVEVMPPTIHGLHSLYVCRHCEQRMYHAYGWYKFCSERCRREHHKKRARTWARDNRWSRAKDIDPRTCQHCGTIFTPKRSDAKFWSTKCRVYHNRLSV